MWDEHVLASHPPSSLSHPSKTFTPQSTVPYCIQHTEGLAAHTHPTLRLCTSTPSESPREQHIP